MTSRLKPEELGPTPLHIATLKEESIELIRELLKQVSEDEINARDKYGYTPLHLALFHSPGNLEVIRAFLNHGASVHQRNIEGQTPLHLSLRHEMNLEVVQELLKHGADVNIKDTYNVTPLQIALDSSTDNLHVIKVLLNNGAYINEKNELGQTPLHIAIEKAKSLEVIQELLRHEVEVNAKDVNNVSALHLALNNYLDPLEVIKELLNFGASVYERTRENRTPLHIAIECGMDLEIINELLKYGAEVDAEDIYHMTPLFIALSTNSCYNFDIIKCLLRYGASVFKKNIKCQTPLHVAIENGIGLIVIKELLKHGAEVNIRDLNHMTPLRKAINRTPVNLKIIKELLKHGASVHEKDTSINILMHVLVRKKISMDVIQELLRYALIEHSDFEECTFCNTLFLNCPNSKCYMFEVDKMKNIYVLDQLTLYDFVVHKYDYDKLYMRELDELTKFSDFSKIVYKEYPLYYDVILDTIETRAYLLRKLCELSVVIVTNPMNQKHINIHPDCLCEIGKFLSRDDLRNFIRAIIL